MQTKVRKKLTLNKETVRKLNNDDLRRVVGGTGVTRLCPTRTPGCNPCLSTSNVTDK